MARGYYHRSGSYALALAKFAEKAGANVDAVVRKVVLDLGTRIVERSPVDTGRFRANWQYGNFSDAGIPTESLPDMDPSGAVSIGRIASELPIKAGGMKHVLVNNLPYAQALEDGYSKQAPHGMVALAVIEFQQVVDEAVSEVKGKG